MCVRDGISLQKNNEGTQNQDDGHRYGATDG